MDIYIFNGTLGQDAEVKTLESGSSLISFSVAVTEKWKDKTSGEWKEKTKWNKCTKWVTSGGSTKIVEYLKKGQTVIVRGVPESKAWVDKEGVAKSNLEVKVDDLTLTGGKRTETQESSSGAPESSYVQQPQQQSSNDDVFGGEESDLPF
jgi:single-strand DNA-binding protein